MSKIAFASCNSNKIAELAILLQDTPYELVSQLDLGVSDIPETGTSFTENALQKAKHLANYVDIPVIADDSGLIIEALDGKPGLHSARFAGIKATDSDNREKLLKILLEKGIKRTPAIFHSTMVLLDKPQNKKPLVVSGELSGEIRASIFEVGFGYEPMFYLDGYAKPLSSMSRDYKCKISHRAQALKNLMAKYDNE